MDFLNGFGRRVNDIARSVSERTREGVELTRLQADLRGATGEMEKLYADYGRACRAVNEGVGDQGAADALLALIRDCERRVEALTRQLDDVRDIRRCPQCGATNPKAAPVCEACGTALTVEAARSDRPRARWCPHCGAALEGEATRCVVCGNDTQLPPETPVAATVEAAKAEAGLVAPPVEAEPPEEPAADWLESTEA